MKFFKRFVIGLFTTFFCIYLSYCFDSSNYLTVVLAKSKIAVTPFLAEDYRLKNRRDTEGAEKRSKEIWVNLKRKGNNSTQISSLLEQSQALYQIGKYVEAVELLKKAVSEFKSTNDRLNEAVALSNLSLAFQHLGEWQEATQAVTQSIKLLQSLENSVSSQQQPSVYAQALDVKGSLELARGETQAALGTWQEAAKIYQQLDDTSASIKNRINQAQAMQDLGNYLQAGETLDSVKEILQKQPNSSLKARGLRSLGNVLQMQGNLSGSQKILEESLVVATVVGDVTAQSNALLSLGNTNRAQRYAQVSLDNSQSADKYTKDAIAYYQRAAQIASAIPTVRLQAQLNQLRLLVEEEDFTTAKALLPQIQPQINNLPFSRTAVNIRVNFAQSLMKMIHDGIQAEDVARMLAEAVQVAQNLKDNRSESYALGTLGELYEQIGQLSDAKDLAQQALVKAESIDAQDIAYQWHWLGARILQKQSNIPAARAAYGRAYNALKSLRQDLVAINPEVQFSFRESVEPVYRQYVDLLLRSEGNTDVKQTNAARAREVMESLGLAELNNFFGLPCVQPKVGVDELVDKQKSTAVIYPIILDDRLEIITRLPGKQGEDNFYHQPPQKIAKEVLENTVEELQKYLPISSREPEIRENSQKLYEWLIKPIEPILRKNEIKTLIFVLNGSLRNIPMAVLYDKQKQEYLIEKYAIALTPGLQLFEPKPLANVQLNALVAGIEQENQIPGESKPFLALPYVTQELKTVQAEVKNSEELLNQELTKESLQHQIESNPFSVVHIATHGQFSSDVEETYITVWQEKLKVEELEGLLRVRTQNRGETIELLVLSACKTATGDKRAALGLAGMAVRAGARSTLATLWTVDDQTTSDFMGKLYQQLNNRQRTKAEALQAVQKEILREGRRQNNLPPPSSWAPYVLVGNWL